MKFVCDFRDELGSLAERVGARGRALAEMAHLGIPVPPGFVVSDVVCRRFLETGDIPGPAWDEILAALDRSVTAISATDQDRPVLFSVRSSPATEMPSVFNSALYLGATEESLERLAVWGGAQLAANVRLGFLKGVCPRPDTPVSLPKSSVPRSVVAGPRTRSKRSVMLMRRWWLMNPSVLSRMSSPVRCWRESKQYLRHGTDGRHGVSVAVTRFPMTMAWASLCIQ